MFGSTIKKVYAMHGRPPSCINKLGKDCGFQVCNVQKRCASLVCNAQIRCANVRLTPLFYRFKAIRRFAATPLCLLSSMNLSAKSLTS